MQQRSAPTRYDRSRAKSDQPLNLTTDSNRLGFVAYQKRLRACMEYHSAVHALKISILISLSNPPLARTTVFVSWLRQFGFAVARCRLLSPVKSNRSLHCKQLQWARSPRRAPTMRSNCLGAARPIHTRSRTQSPLFRLGRAMDGTSLS